MLLQKVEMLFATPAWGDGKNDDSSMVDSSIKIYSTDGNIYAGFGQFRDGSGITKNGDRTMPFEMSGGINQLDSSTITQVSIQITYWIEAGVFHSDHWDFRRELILTFAGGVLKCSGYNEPAYAVDFGDARTDLGPYTYAFNLFHDQRTLVPPYA